MREVAVLVSNATMYKGDKGSVIVGGRVELGDIADEEDPLKVGWCTLNSSSPTGMKAV